MVAMNPATYQKDVAEVRSGGWLIYDSTWPLDERLVAPGRDAPSAFRSPRCATTHFTGVRERILMKNIAYAGALAALLDMDTDDHPRAAQGEVLAQAGADGLEPARRSTWVTTSRRSTSPARCRSASRRWTRRSDSILIDGNTAAALGCLYAGATVGAWYPITPATSLMEAFKGFCQKYRREPRRPTRTALRSCRPKTSSRRSAW